MNFNQIKQGSLEATIVILTKNEARHVARAVESAGKFAQVLVVDSHSTDRTIEIAQEAGASIIEFDWDGAYPKKKEWALQHCVFDWVIYLDADEFFTESLVSHIAQCIKNDRISAIEVPLRYFWLGKELKYGHKVAKRIGMRRSRSSWPRPNDLHVKNMWEVEGHYQPVVSSGTIRMLSEKLGHADEDGLFDYFSRHNRYSDWEAHMLNANDEASLTSRSKKGRLAAKLPAKSIIFFAYSYVLRGGFLDGKAGFHYAVALAFYYWQIDIKRIELINNK